MEDDKELEELGFICIEGGEEDGELQLGTGPAPIYADASITTVNLLPGRSDVGVNVNPALPSPLVTGDNSLQLAGAGVVLGGDGSGGGNWTPWEPTGEWIGLGGNGLTGLTHPSQMSYSALPQDGWSDQTAPPIILSPGSCLPPIRVRCSATAGSSSTDITTPTTAYPEELVGAFQWMNWTPNGASYSYMEANYELPVYGGGVVTTYYQNGDGTFFISHQPTQYSINSASSSMIGYQISDGNMPRVIDPRARGVLLSGPQFTGWESVQDLNGNMDHIAPQMPQIEPLFVQYGMTANQGAQAAVSVSIPPSSTYAGILGPPTAYFPPQVQNGLTFAGNTADLSNVYYVQPRFGPNNVYYQQPYFGQSVAYYRGRHLANPILPVSAVEPGSPRHGDRNMSVASGLGQVNEASMVSGHLGASGAMEERSPP